MTVPPANTRPEGTAPDWTIAQNWSAFTPEQHATWDTLFARQARLLPGRVADEFLAGLNLLRLSKPGIPDFEELSERLMKATGWQVLAVPGLVPDDVFFDHLANRRFVAGNFIRRPDQLDYIAEPDVFHDVFGHVPLLADPVFADYMQAYGLGGQRANGLCAIDNLARLYWYTVEFGLVQSAQGVRIYGAGIASSFSETIFALNDPSPHRIGFDLRRIMRTRYRIDDFQQAYFVIDSFEALLEATLNADFGPLYEALVGAQDIAVGAIEPGDTIVSLGTQSHLLA